MTLTEIFKEIGHFGEDIGCNDKGGTHSYLEIYERLLLPYKNGCTLLEIGLATGDSIKLWDRYFDNSTVIGVDISVVFQPSEYRNTVQIIEGDATKPSFLPMLGEHMFDVIIDDASHMEDDQVNTFTLLNHQMNPGGVYIIEDILSLDTNISRFQSLYTNCEIVDLRHVKGRFDDVLIIYRF